MEVLGLIPARGGSKSIPRKNIRLVGGRPLLAFTAEAALASRCLNRTILSTDDAEIAAVGGALGLETPFLRPAELAADDSLAIDVIRHALEYLSAQEGYEPAAVMLLQPTSPLRRAEHIDEAVELLQSSGADTVVSVVRVPHQYNPVSVMKYSAGRLTPFLPGEMIVRRQQKPEVLARNGPAILLSRSEVFRQGKLYGEQCLPLVMRRIESIDIDDQDDLEYFEYQVARGAARR